MMVRVVTHNIWGRQGDWPGRREVLRQLYARLRPDVVAFQESIVLDGYDQVKDVLPEDYHVWHHGDRTEDGCGASMATRDEGHRLLETKLPHCDQEWIGSLAMLRLGEVVIAHHKPSWQWDAEAKREEQAVAAARLIEREAGGSHVILLGDFDATPDSASMRFWTGRQSLDGMSVSYRDTWEWLHPGDAGHTYTNANPLVAKGSMPLDTGRRIDHILVRCTAHGPTLEAVRCERIAMDPPGSDHYGLVTDFASDAVG